MTNQNVAANIRAELARRRKTQADLAQHLGLGQQGVSLRLAGRVAITVDEVYRAAEFLGLPVEALLADTAAAS